MVSDAHKGLVAAIGECFPGSSWQRCKVHFMRNTLVHVPHKEKEHFASLLKGIWMTADLKTARQRAQELADEYRTKCPKAVETLEEGKRQTLLFTLHSTGALTGISIATWS
ncbi:MAG TPA: transposase [Clostridia bacterium]|nr:transposase [Clostridia bacterium]